MKLLTTLTGYFPIPPFLYRGGNPKLDELKRRLDDDTRPDSNACETNEFRLRIKHLDNFVLYCSATHTIQYGNTSNQTNMVFNLTHHENSLDTVISLMTYITRMFRILDEKDIIKLIEVQMVQEFKHDDQDHTKE